MKRRKESTKRATNDQSWNNLSNKVKNVVLDFNPNHRYL